MQGENTIGFDICGHAHYAPHGEDIVCAAISAAADMTILGITESLKIMMMYTVTNSGISKCILPESKRNDAQAIAFFHAFRTYSVEVQKKYPQCIDIIDKQL